MKNRLVFVALALLAMFTLNCQCRAFSLLGTAFTYQGRLMDSNGPASGRYDLQFSLYDSSDVPGTLIAGPITNAATVVSNGLFTVSLDFGTNVVTVLERYLEVAVRTNGGAAFVTLTPRQRISATPFAIMSENAAVLLGTLPASQLTGTIANGVLPASPNFSGTVTANSFSGNGAGLSNVNALTLGGLGATGFWQVGGNAGTIAGPNFLGTLDNQPLELRANGWRGLRLEPAIALDGSRSNVVNVVGGSSVNFVAPGTYAATIGGGGAGLYFGEVYSNRVSADFGTVGGGQQNSVNGVNGFVGGGFLNTSGDSFSTVGGGDSNTGGGVGSTVGGGLANNIQTNAVAATVGGGFFNLIQTNASVSTIGGGTNNTIQTGSVASTIGGGFENMIVGNKGFGTIAGGGVNIVSGLGATIGGGSQNTAGGQVATVGGGGNNIASAEGATIAGGYLNTNSGIYAAVGGGNQNLASGLGSVVPGGIGNVANGAKSFAAGTSASANHTGAFVWSDSQGGLASSTNDQFLVRARGGVNFLTSGAGLTVDGQPLLTTAGISIQQNSSGAPNVVEGSPYNFVASGVVGGTVGGGGATNFSGLPSTNEVTGSFGTVSGGAQNTAGALGATVGGGSGNAANGGLSTIAGGSSNIAASDSSTVGGGGNNVAGHIGSTVSGGFNNYANGYGSVVGGGSDNTNGGMSGVIGGGGANTNSGLYATIGGGGQNTTSGTGATISGGGYDGLSITNGNVASGVAATIPGGLANVAAGNYSFAAGRRAHANHQGSFVWADSQNAVFASTANDQFDIRASGGVGIGTGSPQAQLNVNGNTRIDGTNAAYDEGLALNLATDMTGGGYGGIHFHNGARGGAFSSSTIKWGIFYNYTAEGNIGGGGLAIVESNLVTRLYFATNGNVGIGTINPTNKLHVVGGVSATAFVNTSDRNAKENFAAVSPQDVLAKVTALPITTWNFKEMRDGRHMGPMAQDFYAAFHLGGSDTTITTVDPDGVALAAIQGLNEKLEQKETEITELKQRLAALEQVVLKQKSN